MELQDRKIDAAPTKDFFINMLVRDIELIPAIGDLVDNSVDGARHLRPDGDLQGLFIRLAASAAQLEIEDNCGGIPVEVAEQYAFRFGRPDGMPPTTHSIGQFGVGMKRALFKLGDAFSVVSCTETERFRVDVDVPAWQHEDEWEFRFTTVGPRTPDDEPGTKITVTNMHEAAARDLAQQSFLTRLASSIGAHHQQSIEHGLLITLNAVPIGVAAIGLLDSEQMHPAKREMILFENTASPVTVSLFAGIVSESQPGDAGWYVYCNGRLVLSADKSEITGWGAASERQFPRYHNRYARFRGYVFFDSDDAGKLPWTTTKTGLDTDSVAYRRVLQSMLDLARPITTFLYEMSRENDEPPAEEGTGLERLILSAAPVAVRDIQVERAFEYTRYRPYRPSNPNTQSIQYRKPIDQIEAVKRALHVATATEVGQRTFDYYYKLECEQSQ